MIEDELDYYYQLFAYDKITTEEEENCYHNYIPIEGRYVCNLCGIYHPYKIYFYENQNPPNIKQKYRRKGYFIEKLKLLIGKKQSSSENYNLMLNDLKSKYTSKDIHELRKIIKNSYGKFSKYIHSIHYDLTGERLINLNDKDIDKLEKEFYIFEKQFKELYPNSYYMLSYNVILYHLLKNNGYEFYKYILLPKNYSRTKNKFCEILRD